jgi:hypothetical protein
MSNEAAWGQVSDEAWARRMLADRTRAERNQSHEQRAITATVMARALDLGAQGFALTGSTARRRRTAISDLDYHVIGERPYLADLPGEVDVVASSATRFRALLAVGDDFGQWTLRYGCILYDAGVMQDAARVVVDEQLWPSADRKLERLQDHHREAERLVQMGDRDAAQEQIRATLTTVARALLLRATVFPLARSELPQQLDEAGYTALSRALSDMIYAEPALEELAITIPLLDVAVAMSDDRSAA